MHSVNKHNVREHNDIISVMKLLPCVAELVNSLYDMLIR